jgi:signal transduction histidine kinase
VADSPADRPGLPRAARLLVAGTVLAATAAAGGALAVGGVPQLGPLALLGLGIAVGELLRIDLPSRRGGTASFGLGDAALAAGLLLLDPATATAGAVAGVLLLQVVERTRPLKLVVNAAQYALGAASAALAVHALTPRPGPVGPREAAVVGLGILLFLAVNAATVGGMIALTGGASLPSVLRAVLPTGTLLALGDLALAVIAVLLADTAGWALPGLAMPAVLLWLASRQVVRAGVDRERSAAFVEAEHALGAAATAEEVAAALAAAVPAVLGCAATLWLDDRWVTAVPEGSSRCTVDGSLRTVLTAPATALGLAQEGAAMAVGLGGGLVLVVHDGDLPVRADAGEWVDRFARSGRVHVARAAASAALAQERATLAAVVDGTGDGVLLVEADGRVAVWNPAMARLTGVDAGEAVGQHVESLLGAGPWQAPGDHEVEREVDGSTWRVAVDEVPEGRVVTVHDVTAERRAARARDDMLGIVSHELRTPLTPIVASAQMLRRRADRLDPAQRDALLDQIVSRAEHLTRLVDDLLLVGQLSGGAPVVARLSSLPIRVDDVVRDAVDAVRLARPDHRVRLTAGEGCVATTDPVRLRQVVDNLLDNACKFSEPGSVVDVLVEADPDPTGPITIEVADQGRGIPPAELERVFERFARVEDPLVMTTSGAGLGLYIVQQVARALGGTVDLRSRLGVGTTATLRLPRLDQLLDRPTTPNPRDRHTGTGEIDTRAGTPSR